MKWTWSATTSIITFLMGKHIRTSRVNLGFWNYWSRMSSLLRSSRKMLRRESTKYSFSSEKLWGSFSMLSMGPRMLGLWSRAESREAAAFRSTATRTTSSTISEQARTRFGSPRSTSSHPWSFVRKSSTSVSGCVSPAGGPSSRSGSTPRITSDLLAKTTTQMNYITSFRTWLTQR